MHCTLLLLLICSNKKRINRISVDLFFFSPPFSLATGSYSLPLPLSASFSFHSFFFSYIRLLLYTDYLCWPQQNQLPFNANNSQYSGPNMENWVERELVALFFSLSLQIMFWSFSQSPLLSIGEKCVVFVMHMRSLACKLSFKAFCVCVHVQCDKYLFHRSYRCVLLFAVTVTAGYCFFNLLFFFG